MGFPGLYENFPVSFSFEGFSLGISEGFEWFRKRFG